MGPKGVAPGLRRPAAAVAKAAVTTAVARLRRRTAAAAALRRPAGAPPVEAEPALAPPAVAGGSAPARRKRPRPAPGPTAEPLRDGALVEALLKPPGSTNAASRAGLQLGRPRGRSRAGAFFEAGLLGAEDPHGYWWRDSFKPGRPAPLVHFCYGPGPCDATHASGAEVIHLPVWRVLGPGEQPEGPVWGEEPPPPKPGADAPLADVPPPPPPAKGPEKGAAI